jgi:hypothetical protein
MMPGDYPLTLYKGDTARWQFKLWTDPNRTSPADLTGVIPKAEIRDKPGGALILAMSCSLELPNIVNMMLSATQSATLPNKGSWDLQLTYPSGDVTTVLAGAITVTTDVTDTLGGARAAAPLRDGMVLGDKPAVRVVRG